MATPTFPWHTAEARLVIGLFAVAALVVAAAPFLLRPHGAGPLPGAAPGARVETVVQGKPPPVPAGCAAGMPAPRPPPRDAVRELAQRNLLLPVAGAARASLYDSFDDARGRRRTHRAIDIHAPRGTPVLAAGDGCVVKRLTSLGGGITLYQFDDEGRYLYYYAHLARYADGVMEGTRVAKGTVLGYVGSTGNAPAHAPHLHFAIYRLGPGRKWWQGEAINPYDVFTSRG